MIRSSGGYAVSSQPPIKTSHGKISTCPREGSVMAQRFRHFASKPTFSISLVGCGNRITQKNETKNLNNLNNLPIIIEDGADHVSV